MHGLSLSLLCSSDPSAYLPSHLVDGRTRSFRIFRTPSSLTRPFSCPEKKTNNSSNKCRLHEKWRPVEVCGPRAAFEVFWISPYSSRLLFAAGTRTPVHRNSVADRKHNPEQDTDYNDCLRRTIVNQPVGRSYQFFFFLALIQAF